MGEENKSWYGSFFNAVKSKSTEVFNLVKNDIEELGTAVKNEASSVVSSTGSVLEKTINLTSADSAANTVKKSFTTFFDQMNTVFNPGLEDSDSEDILIFQGSELVTPSKLQKAVFELQNKEETYLSDPGDDVKKVFDCWLEINEEQLNDEEKLGKHLASSVILQKYHKKLVPDVVSNEDFWKRYLFKKAVLEDEINREEEKEKLANKKLENEDLKETTSSTSESSFAWENEDFSNDIELSEEDQIKLLEDYEKETRERNKKKDEKPTPQANKKDEEANKKNELKTASHNNKKKIRQAREEATLKPNRLSSNSLKEELSSAIDR